MPLHVKKIIYYSIGNLSITCIKKQHNSWLFSLKKKKIIISFQAMLIVIYLFIFILKFGIGACHLYRDKPLHTPCDAQRATSPWLYEPIMSKHNITVEQNMRSVGPTNQNLIF